MKNELYTILDKLGIKTKKIPENLSDVTEEFSFILGSSRMEGYKMSAKVYFNYGTMGSAKSAQLIMNAYQYEMNERKVLSVTPMIGCRENIFNSTEIGIDNKPMSSKKSVIESRIGLKLDAYVIEHHGDVTRLKNRIQPDVIFVDEVQFFTKDMVEELFEIAAYFSIPIYCYGLLTDSSTILFEGSKRLIELGATLNHIKSVGTLGEVPIINAKVVDGNIMITNPNDNNIEVGREDKYKAITLREYLIIK